MTDISPIDRIFCAIDTPKLDDALLLADLLSGEVGAIKLGKEFFTAHGPNGVRKVADLGHSIFLDLKYHDIPNTVAGAVGAANRLSCTVLTVHASGGPAMLKAAADASADAGAKRPKILAVTVLTSLDNDDLAAVGQTGPAEEQVLRLARLARDSGIDGIVCSPQEVSLLRGEIGDQIALVVPGVRPEWAGADDQKRVMTPGEAVAAGADHLVIGRPITRSDDPVGAARRIVDELSKVTA
ncbi:MAG TPA: orotidine-5'-phosphate decarboxylase [Rhodospirillaceae bacterium]|nr:orotidine-5'-phosphate decarboxylase [Rhodospirillaceae bacterium]|tara:strand:+ start:141 stop:860 length:720 start_codon:yes stop_codon:yes gene_type:complete